MCFADESVSSTEDVGLSGSGDSPVLPFGAALDRFSRRRGRSSLFSGGGSSTRSDEVRVSGGTAGVARSDPMSRYLDDRSGTDSAGNTTYIGR